MKKLALVFLITLYSLSVLFTPTLATSASSKNALTAQTVLPAPSFTNPINLSNDGYSARFPWVTNVDSHVYVAWTEGSRGIFFRASANNGTAWYPALTGAAMKISSLGGVADYPIEAALGSDVYVTWAQSVNNELQIFFAGSTNYGRSFSTAIQLTHGNSPNGFITPVIAAAGSNVYIAYTGDGKNSFVTWSNDNGTVWSSPFHFAITHEPQIAAVGSNAYVVADGLQYAITNDAGAHWQMITNATNNGDEPWIAVSGSNVYIASQTKTANGVIHYIRCTSNGTVCNGVTCVDNQTTCNKVLPGIPENDGAADTWEPQLTASGSYVYLAFHRPASPTTVWIRVSNDNGATFGPLINLSGSTNLDGWATGVAVSGNYSYTVWPDRMSSTNWDMFVSYSTNNGVNWTQPPGINVSHNPGVSGPNLDIASSSIAAFSNHAFVVWMDNRTGIYNVLFVRSH